jgi:prophage maintenance system killer protein
MSKISICDIEKIERNFEDVKQKFPEINKNIEVPRDEFNDFVAYNMILAYTRLNELLLADINIFSDKHVLEMLELNHIVLCGHNEKLRYEYMHHLEATRVRFFEGLSPVKRWYNKHFEKDKVSKVAAEIFVGVLSQPQLFIEGNHRTGALIASWILLRGGMPPFVLTVENARAYFNPSSQIKFSDKRVISDKLKLPKYQKSFRKFLETNIKKKFLTEVDRKSLK